jgi:hypothetical protein
MKLRQTRAWLVAHPFLEVGATEDELNIQRHEEGAIKADVGSSWSRTGETGT